MQNKQVNEIRALIQLMLVEDARDLVGDYLWPDGRTSDLRRGIVTNIESDTEREADLRSRVIGFIMNHRGNTLDPNASNDLLTIASDPAYKKTLSLYTKAPVYRGISVSLGWFKRNFGVSYDEVLADIPAAGDEIFEIVKTFERKTTLNPRSAVSSWSKKIVPAIDFATGGGASGSEFSVPIVYEADPKDGSFIDLKKVYDIGGKIPYGGDERLLARSNEQEVISVGPVSVSKIHVLGWKHRNAEKPMPDMFKRPATGYDDIGVDDRTGSGLLRVKRKDLDRDFDKLNISDIE